MNAVLEELQRLEEQLLALGPACPKDCVEALLASGFREFGGSGRVMSREHVLNEIADAPARTCLTSDVQVQLLAHDAALLTYGAVVDGRASIRSSIWVRRSDRWQMLFHQGTRTPQD